MSPTMAWIGSPGNELQQAEDQDDDADQKQHALRQMSRGMPQHQQPRPQSSGLHR